ncbi:MAG: ATPase [Bacillota bacterium]
MKLSTDPDRRYLVVRSPEESFPAAALEEIRQERMATDGDLDFPPCRVEIVLGMEGRLFVVLPTGVKTTLPFACSAPFVQDPARVKIKDPEISPTNRWLLERIGALAARTLISWVGSKELAPDQRAEAYQLLIDPDPGDNSLEAQCAGLARAAFAAMVKTSRWLLTEEGGLQSWQRCAAVPPALLDVWSPGQVSDLFDPAKRPVLSRHVAEAHRQRLVRWGAIGEVSLARVVEVLRAVHPPRPKAWRQLMILWACVATEFSNPRYYWSRPKGVRVVPVQGSDLLHAENEVVRLGERQILQSQDDWAFLSKYLLVLNQNWTRYLAEQRRAAEESKERHLSQTVAAAYRLLKELGLDETSDAGRVLAMVSQKFYAEEDCDRADCIRLAQIAAKLGAPIPDDFEFVTQDDYRRPRTASILVDHQGDLDLFVDEDWYAEHVLHSDYFKAYTSCSEEEWRQWSASPRTGLLGFAPLKSRDTRVWGANRIREELTRRGLKEEPSFPYQSTEFVIEDQDFEPEIWKYWEEQAAQDHGFWARVMARILKQPQSYWSKATTARCVQVARNGHTRAVTSEPLLPAWILKFRELPCLQDTWGRYCKPGDLLRRTPNTEALLDVEPFIRREFDTESLAPLLKLLGVRDTATGSGPILDRLRALAGIPDAPLHEVQKWYHRLDQITDHCSTSEFRTVESAFQTQALILTHSLEWVQLGEVFLSADEEDVPGAAVVHPSIRHLGLWRKLHVPDRPTAELAMDWLKSLPSGQTLSADELRRVRSLLPRYPERIWAECGHWLSLEGEWVPVAELQYALTMQSLVPWKHLFPEVKAKTADLQKLPADLCEREPFSRLPRLGSCIEERFHAKPGALGTPHTRPWMVALGLGLARIILDDPDEMQRVRELGSRLARTLWQPASVLETVPYLGGTPAGTPRRCEVLWREDLLYVEDRSPAKLAAAVPHELGRLFARTEISDAVKLCYERSPEFVEDFLQTAFELAPPEEISEPTQPADPGKEREPARSEVAVTREPEPVRPTVPKEWFKPNDQEPPPSPPQQPKQPKPPQPSLIDLFAAGRGFAKDGADRFVHPDGRWLGKNRESLFPWVLWSANGDPLQHYWVKEHCLEREPLQLESEIWQFCQRSPDRYSLILTTPEGAPVEVSGRRLVELYEREELTIYPATYRLVYRT